MAVSYRFFNSQNGDRTYDSTDWAKYFDAVVTSGIAGGSGSLEVTAGTGLSVSIAEGAILINGYQMLNDDTYSLELSTPAANPRIDAVVIRLDMSTRSIYPYIVEGTEAASPSAQEA